MHVGTLVMEGYIISSAAEQARESNIQMLSELLIGRVGLALFLEH